MFQLLDGDNFIVSDLCSMDWCLKLDLDFKL